MKKITLILIMLIISVINSYGAVYNQDNRISVTEIVKIIEDFEKNSNSEQGAKLRKNMLQNISVYGVNKSPEVDTYVLGFIFHIIKLQIGEEKFNNGIAKIKNLKDMPSLTYLQILRCFEDIDAESFHNAYFTANPVINMNISDVEYISEKGKYYISFTILRTSGEKFINIPYMIEYGSKKEYGRLQSSINREEAFKVPVELGSALLYIDPNYHLLRTLGDNEKTPVIADMLVKENITLITDNQESSIAGYFNIGETINNSEYITFSQIENKNIIIEGYNNKIAQFFVDKAPFSSESSDYFIFKNPQNKEKYILIINNPKNENLKLLNKYGINQQLIFKGQNIIKEATAATNMGYKVLEHKADTIVFAENTSTMEQLINKSLGYKNIFIGEVHTDYSHHANQLSVIENIYKRKKNIAIAMEMVQVKYMSVLNDFVMGRISEKEMLEKIHYYENWSYDYSLYAPIFQYARDNNIDIIPLNIPRSVTSKVYNGSIDNLTSEEKNYLPKKMNVINHEYEKSLYEIFSIHKGTLKEFSNFYLSQNIWDEVMAKNMADYRMANPDTTIIALCGNGHAGKNSGIPYRYKRITGEESFVIMQSENIDKEKADLFIFPEYVEGRSTPKIGVALEEVENKVKITSVAKQSPAEKAGLKTGDEIVKCGYHNINNIGNLKYALYEKGYNTTLECEIIRNKKPVTKYIKLVPYEDSSVDDMIKAHIEKVKGKK